MVNNGLQFKSDNDSGIEEHFLFYNHAPNFKDFSKPKEITFLPIRTINFCLWNFLITKEQSFIT